MAATKKFSDSLTGRKSALHLPPVLWTECTRDFNIHDLDRRLLHGGLPELLLDDNPPPSHYSEWLDSFYARDIQELFSVRNRSGFLKLLHLLIRQSGGLVDYTALSKLSELSRPSVKSYIESLVIAQALTLLPPFHGGGRRELTQRPNAYGFDTGFVSFIKGWNSIRDDDRGLLWEHLVLDCLKTQFHFSNIFYWRDKSNREVDFVIKRSDGVDTIECKINPDHMSPKSLQAFRQLYTAGKNICICPYIKSPYSRRLGDLTVWFHSLESYFGGK